MTYQGAIAPDEEISDRDFAALADLLRSESRISLSPAKKTLVCARLARRLRARSLASYADYLRLIRDDETERRAMITALTTNHTSFFRESHHFDHFRTRLLPRLQARAGRGEKVRIWSAGSSSGEEVYTIAMCLLGTSPADAQWLRTGDVRLLATDISPPMIEAVKVGRYSAEAAQSVPEAYRLRWMKDLGDGMVEMAPEARALISARPLNLFGDWPMRQSYDAVFCRNVMIYFDEPAKRELEQRLIGQLAAGGFLYIGHSERLGSPGDQQVSVCGQTIYQKHGGQA